MTDEHLKVFDETLWLLAQRVWELAIELPSIAKARFPKNGELQPALRESPLGKKLFRVIAFAAGDEVQATDQEIQSDLEGILRQCFACPLSAEGYTLPRDLHKTALGCILYDARARLISYERLLRPADVVRILGVRRQVIASWIKDRTLTPEYLHGELRFDRVQVEALRKRQELHSKQQRPSTQSIVA
ncbi:MAG: hypothetical protein H0U76_21825 [Ktedonobacteraceae bacterium]|nr:hypothetical protein [Ktedonobacteraceae bacterium]